MSKNIYDGIASTSKDAYRKRKHTGKEKSQKEHVLSVFKSGGSYSIHSMHKATGIAEKSLSGVFHSLRHEWKIVFYKEAKNATKANANYFVYNPNELPPQRAIRWEIEELERVIERRDAKQDKSNARLQKLYLMLENEKDLI